MLALEESIKEAVECVLSHLSVHKSLGWDSILNEYPLYKNSKDL